MTNLSMDGKTMSNNEFIRKKIAELEEELQRLKELTSDEEYFKVRSDERVALRRQQMFESKKKKFDTVSLWGLYGIEDMKQFKSMILPIFSTTTGSSYETMTEAAMMLSYQIVNDPNKIYSRIDNTTIDHLAMKIAALEGKTIPDVTEGLMVSSGMSAVFMATMPFLDVGDRFVSSNRVYGGTEQLFNVTYKKMGWNVDWVDEPWSIDSWQEQITPKTKFLYVESPSNPLLFVADIPELAKLAHDHGVPLIVDSTLASPVLMRPLEHGADIVVHSVTKIMGSSGRAIAGAIVAKEKIVTNVEDLAEHFVTKVKGGHFRNLGPCLHPPSAAAIWDNLNSLPIRVRAHSERAQEIAEYLENHEKIEAVNYPGLKSHPQHEIAKKLMKFEDGSNGYGFLMSFKIKGGLEKTIKFALTFNFGVQVTDLGRDYTTWIHPYTTTHGQMSPEMKKRAGIDENLIRYSVGLEASGDAIQAFEEALSKL